MKNWMLLVVAFCFVAGDVNSPPKNGQRRALNSVCAYAGVGHSPVGGSPAVGPLGAGGVLVAPFPVVPIPEVDPVVAPIVISEDVLNAIEYVSLKLFFIDDYKIRRDFCGWIGELNVMYGECAEKNDAHFAKIVSVLSVMYPRLNCPVLDVSSHSFRCSLSRIFKNLRSHDGWSLFLTDDFDIAFVGMCVYVPLCAVSRSSWLNEQLRFLIERLLESAIEAGEVRFYGRALDILRSAVRPCYVVVDSGQAEDLALSDADLEELAALFADADASGSETVVFDEARQSVQASTAGVLDSVPVACPALPCVASKKKNHLKRISSGVSASFNPFVAPDPMLMSTPASAAEKPVKRERRVR